MKYIIVIIALLSLGACKKDGSEPYPPLNTFMIDYSSYTVTTSDGFLFTSGNQSYIRFYFQSDTPKAGNYQIVQQLNGDDSDKVAILTRQIGSKDTVFYHSTGFGNPTLSISYENNRAIIKCPNVQAWTYNRSDTTYISAHVQQSP